MADGYDDSQIERMREQVRMSMGAMCDALSVTSVMSHGDPVAGTLDLNLESSVAMAVLGTSGSIDSNMMVTLLDGASPDITDSETLVTQLEDAIDAMGQVLDSEIAAPSAASGHPTIAADISVPLIVDDATVGAVMVFLAPRETTDQVGAEPTAEEAALVKREWWQMWKKEDPPICEYIIMSLDAAAETHNRADYTGLTTWGVFLNEEVDNYNIILLNSIKRRLEFPELKELAMNEYREWEPDSFIVEKKSAGTALYQEMRRMGIPIQEYTPHRGSGDKLARLNSVTDIVSSGLCWVPETRWAEELIEEIAGFPFMSHDDLVDSTVMALMRFRQGGFIRLPSDEPEEVVYFKQKRGGYY